MNGSAYDPQKRLLAPLRARAQIWRIALALGIVAIASTLLTTLFLSLAVLFLPAEMAIGLVRGEEPLTMLLLLMSFAMMILSVHFAAKLLLQRGVAEVLGNPQLLKSQFLRVLSFLLLVNLVVFLLPPYDLGAPLEPKLDLRDWLWLLPLSLAGVLLQVSAEELVFRGLFQQMLAARFKSPVAWLFLPSLLFGLGHYMPAEAGDNAWLISLWAICFGCAMADLTARAGSLGPAIAVHFVNNVIALLLVASPSSLNGLALFLLPYEMSDTEALPAWLLVDATFVLVAWLTARLAIRR